MQQTVFTAFLLFIAAFCRGQTYVSIAPSLTNTAGTIAEKSNLAFELGRQWDVFSLGIDAGKSTFGKMTGRDTSLYLEIRPNLNIFQVGKFTSTLTPGSGYIFNAKESLLTELTYGIEYSINDQLHINAFLGQYFYSGRYTASNVSFFGISCAWYFKAFNNKSLIGQAKKERN